MNEDTYFKLFAAELDSKIPELDLHGFRIDEACSKLELFLYEKYNEKKTALKIIYGGGTGKLREKVLEYLHKAPLVDTIHEQGGSCIILLTS